MVEAPCTAICTSNKQLPLNSSGRKLCDYHKESAIICMKGRLSLEMCAQCNVSGNFTPLLCNYPEN